MRTGRPKQPLILTEEETRSFCNRWLIARGSIASLPSVHLELLGFAIYDCLVEKRHPEGNFRQVVESLLAAGSPREKGVDEVLAAPQAS
jgi:hypothetical protein